ncbi:MAG: CotH kinase family protein [Acidobacteriota bacterium]
MRGARLSPIAISLAVAGLVSLGVAPSAQTPGASTLTADALFQTSKVWTIHLTLPNDSFSALMPMAPATPPPSAVQVAAPPREIPTVLPLDLLKMVAAGGFLGPEGGRNGISGSKGIDFAYVHASLDFAGIKFADVAVRPKGNGTYNPVLTGKVQKPSLKIDLNKFVKGQKLAGVTTINLHNSLFDPTWMNEALAFRLYRDAGVPAPRTAFARVYLTAKGGEADRYLGLYTLVENVDESFTQSRFKVDGGALFKPVTILPFKFLSKDWKDYNQMYDPKTDLTDADKQRVIDFCDMLTHASDDVFTAQIGSFLDVDAFAKYMAVVVWMANPDSLLEQGQNYYVHFNPTTKKYVFLPWDQDHSFGQFIPWRSIESQQKLDIMHPWVNRFERAPFASQVDYDLMTRTFKLEAFKRSYLAALAALTRTLTQPERIAKQVDDLIPVLAPIVAEEPKDGRVISFNEATHEGTFRRPFNQSSPEINPIKVFVPIRQGSVLAQLRALGVQ